MAHKSNTTNNDINKTIQKVSYSIKTIDCLKQNNIENKNCDPPPISFAVEENITQFKEK